MLHLSNNLQHYPRKVNSHTTLTAQISRGSRTVRLWYGTHPQGSGTIHLWCGATPMGIHAIPQAYGHSPLQCSDIQKMRAAPPSTGFGNAAHPMQAHAALRFSAARGRRSSCIAASRKASRRERPYGCGSPRRS